MSQRKMNIQFRVGIFVFIGVVFLFAYILLIGENRTLFTFTSQYKVKFQETHGLFVGSVVTINGVPAGNVISINFIEDTGRVEATISVMNKFASVITDKSTAMVVTKGLLGDKYISIVTKGINGKRLKEGDYIHVQILSGALGFLSSKASGEKLQNILNEVFLLLQAINSQKMVEKANRAIDNMSSVMSKNNAKQLSLALKRLNSILKKIDEGKGSAGAFINNRSFYNRVLALLGQSPLHKYLPELMEEDGKK